MAVWHDINVVKMQRWQKKEDSGGTTDK